MGQLLYQLARWSNYLCHNCLPASGPQSTSQIPSSQRENRRNGSPRCLLLSSVSPGLEAIKINCSAVVCLTIALEWGGTQYAWKSSVIIGLFVGFGLMIIIFIGLQFYRGDKATLPPSILKQRSIASAALFMFLMGASMFVMIYYSPHTPTNFSFLNLIV